ncbi:carboxylesterase family protein [Brenneria goodwinii]|uniref:Carboxylesterase type B n=1 Tax=Brenneria goodwinii TaxID=1109412 RepID=A0A0G4K2A4_9GAMM|nr:carboxylesterase family protein [Brenneria goodwinii]MCG8157641.1 carboxylesterase family protein [Brenneria goodwinii]MCG8161118.1 carboxylesterase family protein [Brenneria goodwinii]MCG8165464.1 carboxylesterase family protein [Brenneria goodwinii]MCG8169947.1 carboxylesterase family protein [Brenneria goodwinii]MCG8177451.1 carboxylesterase family protein [Brenneria goodwinii]
MNKSLAAGLMIILSSASYSAFANGPEITLDSGRIAGTTIQDVDVFKGIPFASPPVGELRWQPPQPVQHWTDVRPALEYGKDCMQEPFPGDAAPLGVGFSEDCLTVNVWRPANANGPLPVMVWIYGGGFVNGGSSPGVYSGEEFARQGVVFVSFNYRVGRFGFFAHPALADQPLRGNYGLMDQIAALQWVQKNIAAFQGDAQNVTLFGESAGGFSVGSMLTTDLAKGLFQKAIIQSGSGRQNMVPKQDWQQAEQAGLAFAQSNDISGKDEKALEALRQIPADKIVNGLNMATMSSSAYSGPMIDGKVITGEPQDLYRQGAFQHVPLMIGATDADIGFPAEVTTLDEAVAVFADADRQKAKLAYQGMSPQAAALAIASDAFMVEPARFVAHIWDKAGVPVWQYRFGYVAESMRDQWPAAVHASEIPYVFNTLNARYADKVTVKDQAVARQTHQYWVNFARTGQPGAADLPQWNRYSLQKDNILIIPASGAEQTKEQTDPWKTRLDLVEKLAEQHTH